MDNEIDESWTHEFRDKEGPYNCFYKAATISVKLFFLYVGCDGELASIKSERVMLDAENLLKRDTLCGTIKKKELCDGVRYKIISLLRFNIDAEPEHALDMLDRAVPTDYTYDVSYMSDIRFQDTITSFHDLNSIFFLFQEDTNDTRQSIKSMNRTKTNRTKTIMSKTRSKRA